MTDKRGEDSASKGSGHAGEGSGPTTTPSGAGYGNDAGERQKGDAEGSGEQKTG